MDSNLPATRSETASTHSTDSTRNAPLEQRRPISVAFLPLALVTFMVIAFIIAAWTFFAAAT